MNKLKLIPKNDILKGYLNPKKNKLIILRHGHIAINNYALGDNIGFEKFVSIWNKSYFRWELKGGYYVRDFKEFRIPRGYPLEILLRFFSNRQIVVDNNSYPYDDISIKLTTSPNKDVQKVALTHMLSKGQYEHLAKYTQQIINADTGDGKTYCAIASSVFLSAKTVIFVPFSKLVPQWYESYSKFTDIKPDKILLVKGSKKCLEILEGQHKDKLVFIFMVDTFTSFHSRYGDMATMKMMYETGAYVKYIDETHRKLAAIIKIEALCNFRMNYYMTASFGRADEKEDRILNTAFKNVPKFGADFKQDEEKHINIFIKKYKFTPTQAEINMMYRRNTGLNIKSYESVLLNADNNRKRSFDESIKTMLTWSLKTIKPENRILFLCSTIDGIHYIKDILSSIYPVSEIGEYHYKISPKDKIKQLEKRIIISTDGSLGTGAHIDGLEHVHSIITYSNAISAKQLPGRGRRIDGVKIIYIEYVNFGYIKTMNQYLRRKPSLEKNTPTRKVTEFD